MAKKDLFMKFGEFDSVEELNKAAAGQLSEGDLESLKALAEENGIDPIDVEDYISGDIPELATVVTAAIGRIYVEESVIKEQPEQVQLPCLMIAEFVESMLTDEELAKAVMKKGRRIMELDKVMFEERCISGSDRDLQEIIKAYYVDGKEAEKKVIADIKKRYKRG